MIDQRRVIAKRIVAQFFKGCCDTTADFIEVVDILECDLAFFHNTEAQCLVKVVKELRARTSAWYSVAARRRFSHFLACRRHHLEVSGNVAAEHACFERLHVSSHVRLGFEQVTFVHGVELLDMSIRHDNTAAVGFHLC